jgi:hypothetical protein
MRQWMDGAARLGLSHAAVSYCIHPFEFVEWYRLNQAAYDKLDTIVQWLRDDFQAEFVNMERFATELLFLG